MVAFILITLFFTFSLAGFLTWRENNLKQDMQRDIRQEFLDKHKNR